MKILRLLLIFTALLFILLQRVDVRVTKGDKFTVKISFIFLALVLEDDKSGKRNFFRPFSIFSGRLRGIFKSLKYLLSKSDITFLNHENQYPVPEKNTPIFDVSFHFSLFHLIISSLILIYYIIKTKVKRVI